MRKHLHVCTTRTTHLSHDHLPQCSLLLTDAHPRLDDLLRRAADRRTRAFRPGTVANHERYMRAYVAFCLSYQLDDLTPTAHHLSAYVEFLLHSGISPSTVPNFLAGIKHYLQATGMDASALSSYTLGLTLRSLRIDYTQVPHRKEGLTLTQVRRLVNYCDMKGLIGYTLKLAILLAFFGLLRISNLAPVTISSFNPLRDSTRDDLFIAPPGLQFAQRWAKNRQQPTAPTDTPHIPLMHLPGDPLDPVQALLNLHNLTPSALPQEPMLLIPTADGHYYPLDQHRLRAEFRQALIACNLDPRQYTPHSLRRGATLLHNHGAHLDDIKRQGLWRSDAVGAYVNDRTLTRSSVLQAITDSVRDRTPSPRLPPQHSSPPVPRPRSPTRHPARRHRHRQPQKYKKGPNYKNRHGPRPPSRGR